jgi:acetoacetyl-CoA reductase
LALGVERKGVTVNTISPGYIGTKMVMAIPKEVLDTKILPQIPLGHLGAPEEIAGLIIYLCSDEAAFVNSTGSSWHAGCSTMQFAAERASLSLTSGSLARRLW